MRVLLERHFPNILFVPVLFQELRKSRIRNLDSQFGELSYLRQLISKHNIESYIDIGAGRPVSGSLTYFLYKQGLQGITVDPIKLNYRLHRLIRRRDKSFRSLCGESKTATFHQFFPYEYSTVSDEQKKNLISNPNLRARFIRSDFLPVKTLSSIASLLEKERNFLLSIDAEGSDFEIIQTLNLETFRPSVIVIEDWEFSNSSISKIHKLLTSRDFRMVSRLGPSSIYVDFGGGGGI